jgi:hypothetical protein
LSHRLLHVLSHVSRKSQVETGLVLRGGLHTLLLAETRNKTFVIVTVFLPFIRDWLI